MIGVLLRVLIIIVLPHAAHSADVENWLGVLRALRLGQNPYSATTFLNWPPLWMQVLFFLDRVATFTGIDIIHLIQTILISAEAIGAVLLASILNAHRVAKAKYILLFGYSANIILLTQVCQHLNFDIIVGALVIGYIWFLDMETRAATERLGDYFRGSLSVGLGILAKTIPLVLAPIVYLDGKRFSRSDRVTSAILFFGPVALGISVIYTLTPFGVEKNVLGYRSASGWFGVSGILTNFISPEWTATYERLSPAMFLLLMLVVALSFRTRAMDDRSRVLASSFLLVSIPSIGPGYGPQYVSWFALLLVLAYAVCDLRWLRWLLLAFYLIGSVTYLIEYAMFPSHGMALAHLRWFDIERSVFLSWTSPEQQTLARLPLFAGYLLLLIGLGLATLSPSRSGKWVGARPGVADPG